LLTSEGARNVIQKLSALADIVIFDTPPLGALTDAVVLSTHVDGSLLVVKSGSARPSVMVNGIDAIRKVGAKPLGVVLNMVDISSLRDYSYYYYYSQGGYYGDVTPAAAAAESF
jgi:Mrp family chromosome partitioning ATPase